MKVISGITANKPIRPMTNGARQKKQDLALFGYSVTFSLIASDIPNFWQREGALR